MKKPDQFEYINNYYGLNLTKNCPVIHQQKAIRGQVKKADGAHIYIQWDYEARESGPYHPTDHLIYPKDHRNEEI